MLLIPVSLFVAVVFTYNKLSADSELVVMRAMGLSRWQLAQPALLVAVCATLFCYALSLYFLPLSQRQFNDMSSFLRDNYTSVLLQEEVFNTPIDGLTVFVRERDEEGNLGGILVHDNRVAHAPVTMMAEHGKLVQGNRGPQFYLEQGIRQEMRDGRMSWLNFDHYTLDISFYTGVAGQRDRDPSEQYVGELLSADRDDEEFVYLRAEAHQRLVWPLYNVSLAMMAVAVLLSGEFSRRGQWRRILIASAAAVMIALVGVGLRNMVVKQPMLIPMMYLVVVMVVGAAMAVLMSVLPVKTPPSSVPEQGGA